MDKAKSSPWPWLFVVLLLAVHAGLVAYSAMKHSPTLNEPGHLVAGLTHWRFGRFEVYRVNPPLSHAVAAIPVMLAGYEEDWSGFYDSPGARPEFRMGANFIAANGERSIWLFTLARWACIPFSLIGGLVCFLWARELWNSSVAGLIAVSLWCFEPNILAHAEMVTPDMSAASLGLAGCYLFWRWLCRPSWPRAFGAGLLLGLSQLTKSSWLILFGLLPAMWLFWLVSEWWRDRRSGPEATGHVVLFCWSLPQMTFILVFMLYVLNLGYGFDGSFTKLKDFEFVSSALSGQEKAGDPGNRFRETGLGELPVPLPMQFVRGVDLQKKDFERYGQSSYLRGEWKRGGWWYYYLYGFWVKTPHGTQLLFVMAVLTALGMGGRSLLEARSTHSQQADEFKSHGITGPPSFRDVIILAIPALTLLVLVSSQTEFNHHFRYVLPVFGFAFVFTGAMGTWFEKRNVDAC